MKSLVDLMAEGRVIRAICPRCKGTVTLPTEVRKVNLPGGMYRPQGQCHRCGVGWAWHTKENPVGTTAINRADIGMVDVWYCDRKLDAPAPTVMNDDTV